MKKYLPHLVFLIAILQIVIPYLLITQGFFNEKTSLVLYIQPAGYAFAIWGLIYLFASLYAIYQVVPQYNNKIVESNRKYALVLFAGSSLWLWASNLPQTWLWITVPILVVMAYVGYKAVRVSTTAQVSPKHRWAHFFSWQCLIIYAAWVNIAQFVNIGSMFTQYGLFESGTIWEVINILFLLFIALWLWIQYKLLNYSIWYGSVVVWALIGVFVANGGLEGNKIIMYISAVLTVPFLLAMARKGLDEVKRYKVVKD